MRQIIIVTALSMLTGACASIVNGTSQEIAIASNPSGAKCDLVRNKEPLSSVVTPQTIKIKKTKYDINIACNKDGYQTSTAVLDSKIQDATWGNIILGGGIGWAVDSASGADNKYDKQVTVTLVPAEAKGMTGVMTTETPKTDGGAAAIPAAPAKDAPKLNW
jgi:hypothetical protein